MPSLTILKPINDKYVTTKTFKMVDGVPTKHSSYNAGKFFYFKTINIKGIAELYNVLDKVKDTNAFRIYGQPTKEMLSAVAQQKKDMVYKGVARQKVNFDAVGTELLLIDADNWPVPDGFTIDTKENLDATVQEIVINQMGLSFLDEVHYCCLLSASQWNPRLLRAHLYYIIDENISLAELTRWGKAQNILSKDYKIDHSLFRQVQPDYISKRLCQGFMDPLPDSLRLTLHCDSLLETVSKADLLGHLGRVETQAGNEPIIANGEDPDDPYATNVLVGDGLDPIASTWEKSLDMCGKYIEATGTVGINEPAFRACAQLVQSKGNKEVRDHLGSYVDRVFSRMWESIRKHGHRNDADTRQVYTKDKIKGYIETALAKDYGRGADEILGPINRLIDQIRVGAASAHSLLDPDMMDRIRELKEVHRDKFPVIRERVRSELKGKLTLSEFDKALKETEPSINETEEIAFALDQFEWFISTQDKAKYARQISSTNQAVLTMDGVHTRIKDILLERVGVGKYEIFARATMNRVDAQSDDPIVGRFTTTPIALRSFTLEERGKNKVYFNMAMSDGLTLLVTEDGIEKIPNSETPVIWRQTDMVAPAPISDYEPTVATLGYIGKDMYIEEYLKGMRRFTTVNSTEDLIEVMSWQVVAAVNSGIANLLQIVGSSEGGKSSTAQFTKELIDPSSSDLRNDKKMLSTLPSEKEYAKIMDECHATILDNINYLSKPEQTRLCTTATGIQVSSRRLYANVIDNILIKKPIVITAICEVATTSELLTRTMTVEVDKKMKVFSTDIYSDWTEKVEDMRTGFLFLLSEIIGCMNERRANRGNLNDRNVWSIEAKKVLYKRFRLVPQNTKERDLERIVIAQKADNDTHIALNNGHVCAISAWLIHGKEFIGQPANTLVNYSTAEAFKSFEQFVSDQFGMDLMVYGAKRTINANDGFKTQRAFSDCIRRDKEDIKNASGWTVTPIRHPIRHNGASTRVIEFLKVFITPG